MNIFPLIYVQRIYFNLCCLCPLSVSFLTDLKGNTTSVERNIQQAVSQVNKVLHSANYDYKKLEVSDCWRNEQLISYLLEKTL